MQFLAVQGEPIEPAPTVPLFPAATVTTKLGLLKMAVSRFVAVVSYVGEEVPHEWFWT